MDHCRDPKSPQSFHSNCWRSLPSPSLVKKTVNLQKIIHFGFIYFLIKDFKKVRNCSVPFYRFIQTLAPHP